MLLFTINLGFESNRAFYPLNMTGFVGMQGWCSNMLYVLAALWNVYIANFPAKSCHLEAEKFPQSGDQGPSLSSFGGEMVTRKEKTTIPCLFEAVSALKLEI